MKRIKLTKLCEASELSAVEKMELFNKGERRENVKACAIAKLLTYYDICIAREFHRAADQIEDELLRRDLPEYIMPNPGAIAPYMFDKKLAEFIKSCGDDPSKKAVENAIKAPVIGTTTNETFVIYLLLAMALDVYTVVSDIKRELHSRCVILYRYMPDVLRKILEDSKIKAAICSAVSGLI